MLAEYRLLKQLGSYVLKGTKYFIREQYFTTLFFWNEQRVIIIDRAKQGLGFYVYVRILLLDDERGLLSTSS